MKLTEMALRNLPVGKFVRFANIEDMSGETRQAVVWEYTRPYLRRSYFSIWTGDYLGEALE